MFTSHHHFQANSSSHHFCSQLAEELNVSQRAIHCDIETISAAGITVTSYHGTNGGFGIIKDYKWGKTIPYASSMVRKKTRASR
ncbi:HTH domain-containing protein [Exiguobacterium sp. S22-S28]|uniref:HTH domain-containing protein n=1 Tax=Exiguobacterium sp. S22-S28 TaxID=3342768 RepID=UPI00372D66A6